MTGLITLGGFLLHPCSAWLRSLNSVTLLCVLAASSQRSKGRCFIGSQAWQEKGPQGFRAEGQAGQPIRTRAYTNASESQVTQRQRLLQIRHVVNEVQLSTLCSFDLEFDSKEKGRVYCLH